MNCKLAKLRVDNDLFSKVPDKCLGRFKYLGEQDKLAFKSVGQVASNSTLSTSYEFKQ